MPLPDITAPSNALEAPESLRTAKWVQRWGPVVLERYTRQLGQSTVEWLVATLWLYGPAHKRDLRARFQCRPGIGQPLPYTPRFSFASPRARALYSGPSALSDLRPRYDRRRRREAKGNWQKVRVSASPNSLSHSLWAGHKAGLLTNVDYGVWDLAPWARKALLSALLSKVRALDNPLALARQRFAEAQGAKQTSGELTGAT